MIDYESAPDPHKRGFSHGWDHEHVVRTCGPDAEEFVIPWGFAAENGAPEDIAARYLTGVEAGREAYRARYPVSLRK